MKFLFLTRWAVLATSGLLLAGCGGLAKTAGVSVQNADPLRLQAIDEHTQAEACKLTALELAAAEKDEHAIAQFQQARKFSPEISGVAHPLAVLYDRQGRIDAADREYRQALQELPGNADVHNDYGYFLYGQKNYPAARDQLEQALKLNAKHPKARVNLATVFCAEGRFDEGFAEFEQAVGPAAAHHNTGLFLLRAGRHDEGLDHLRQAARRDPSLGSERILATVDDLVAGS